MCYPHVMSRHHNYSAAAAWLLVAASQAQNAPRNDPPPRRAPPPRKPSTPHGRYENRLGFVMLLCVAGALFWPAAIYGKDGLDHVGPSIYLGILAASLLGPLLFLFTQRPLERWLSRRRQDRIVKVRRLTDGAAGP